MLILCLALSLAQDAAVAPGSGRARIRPDRPVDALALVADDELEQTVALEAVVKRATREPAAP